MGIEYAQGAVGKDTSGLYLRNEKSGFRVRVGNISSELMYEAAERMDYSELESWKATGPVIGAHLKWTF